MWDSGGNGMGQIGQIGANRADETDVGGGVMNRIGETR